MLKSLRLDAIVIAIISVALLAGCGDARVDPPAAAAKPASAPAVDAAKKPTPTAAPTPAPAAPVPPPKPAPIPVKHLAVGAKVTVSSTHSQWPGEDPATALVDGDASTRWSSNYADNQEVTVDLGEAKAVGSVKVMWQRAAATRWAVQTSSDGNAWSAAIDKTGTGEGPRTDDVAINASVRFIKLLLKERVNPKWGFSIMEIVVEK